MSQMAICSDVNAVMAVEHTPAVHGSCGANARRSPRGWAIRAPMSAATAAPVRRDIRVMSLIGVAHGVSHYHQLAFVTMLLIVRDSAGLSFTDVGILGGLFYGVSGIAQT